MTDKLNGYKTVIFNVVVLVASILSLLGVILPADEQAGIAGAIFAVVGIILRFKTSTPVFNPPAPPVDPSPPPAG